MTDPQMPKTIDFDQFLAVDIRAGKVVAVAPFPEARKAAWKLTIDFGPEIGTKRSSAQITDLYGAEDLLGKMVAGVVNLPPLRIGPFVSETLTLGFRDEQGRVVLVTPDKGVAIGSRLF